MTTERRTPNMTSVFSHGEPQSEYPDQVAQNIVPSTYEKDTNPLVRLKEGMKKIVGKGTRGVGPKHSRAKPNGITGKQHAEETAQDMFGLHDALHEGLDNNGHIVSKTSQDSRVIPGAHMEANGSSAPEGLIAESQTGTGTDQGTDSEGLMNRNPIHDLHNQQGKSKQMSAPSAGVGETTRTPSLEDRRERGKDILETRREDQLASRSVPAGQIQEQDDVERRRHDSKTSHLEGVKDGEQLRKDPAEGITPGVKAAFIEDQRERAILGNKKFEQGRLDRSKEGGEPSIGSKLLAGITTVAQSATQGIKSAATMVTGPKGDTPTTEARKESS